MPHAAEQLTQELQRAAAAVRRLHSTAREPLLASTRVNPSAVKDQHRSNTFFKKYMPGHGSGVPSAKAHSLGPAIDWAFAPGLRELKQL